MINLKNQKNKIDRTLLILTLVFTLAGLIAVADASSPQAINFFSDRFFFVKQQAVWALFGIFSLIIASLIPYKFWGKISLWLFIASGVMLIVVLIPGVGTKALGARRWLSLGYVSIQPSEFAKIAIAIYFAKLSSKGKGLLAYLGPLALICLLIMLQPDLGTTIVIFAIGFIQIFLSGANFLQLLGIILSGGVIGSFLIMISDYRRERFLTFIQQAQDPLGSSYHIRQVLISLAMGGLFGVGLGQSRQKFLYLPEAATDSIFAIIAEEVGFVGASVLIVLFSIFIFKALKIASRAPDKFSQSLASGITAWIGVQMFLNLGSMFAIVPLTGITLPFFSYGGSSLTMVLFATGILLNISKYESKKSKRS